jgi:hypothetical protein
MTNLCDQRRLRPSIRHLLLSKETKRRRESGPWRDGRGFQGEFAKRWWI